VGALGLLKKRSADMAVYLGNCAKLSGSRQAVRWTHPSKRPFLNSSSKFELKPLDTYVYGRRNRGNLRTSIIVHNCMWLLVDWRERLSTMMGIGCAFSEVVYIRPRQKRWPSMRGRCGDSEGE